MQATATQEPASRLLPERREGDPQYLTRRGRNQTGHESKKLEPFHNTFKTL
jgi:hypothetical protein